MMQLKTCLDIPAPLAYYNFENDSGGKVIDKGANGFDGDINRTDQLTIGGSGPPTGPSPITAANFQGGYINSPSVDLTLSHQFMIMS